MRQLLVYSDSLSWGIIPATRERLAFKERWPGITERALLEKDLPVRVIENCLNDRRTVWEDPFKAGRNGLHGIEQVIEMHSPLALVVLMLGSNDFQSMHPHNAWHAAQGITALINAIRNAPMEPEMPLPKILLVTPPPITMPKGPLAPKFHGAAEKCIGLEAAYRAVAEELDCLYFDAGAVVTTSHIDGIHLDKDQHEILGNAIAEKISKALTNS